MARARILEIAYDKTSCGTPFYMRAGNCHDIKGRLSFCERYTTDFFQLFFFTRINGSILIGCQRTELKDSTCLIISPHEQITWDIDEESAEYQFIFFREDFIGTFISDPLFLYKLLYCFQPDTPASMTLTREELADYVELVKRMNSEIAHPVADSYHICVSLLYHILLSLNRIYARQYDLPFLAPANNFAYKFKELLQRDKKRPKTVSEYAVELKISRISLNNFIKRQFGVTANHLIKRQLLATLKNEILYGNKTITQLAIDYGFSHPSHLMRFFKSSTGQTITNFKKKFL